MHAGVSAATRSWWGVVCFSRLTEDASFFFPSPVRNDCGANLE